VPIPAGPGGLAYATVDQVEGRYRPLTDAEKLVVADRLGQASRMLRGRFRDLDARIAAGTLDSALAGDAAINMVLRVMPSIANAIGNPNRLRAATTGPFRREFDTSSAAAQPSDMAITDAEVALLAPPSTDAGRVPAKSIRVVAGLAPPRTSGWCGVRGW
jgi:hypothetical protein